MSHKIGSMSFVAMWHEISQKELNGEECDRIMLFKCTYCNSAGVWANAHVEEYYNEMQRILAESEAEGNSMTIDEICNKVLGVCSRYIRRLGRGPKSHQASSSKFKVNQLEEQLKESRLKNHKLKEDVHELKERLDQQRRLIEMLLAA